MNYIFGIISEGVTDQAVLENILIMHKMKVFNALWNEN